MLSLAFLSGTQTQTPDLKRCAVLRFMFLGIQPKIKNRNTLKISSCYKRPYVSKIFLNVHIEEIYSGICTYYNIFKIECITCILKVLHHFGEIKTKTKKKEKEKGNHTLAQTYSTQSEFENKYGLTMISILFRIIKQLGKPVAQHFFLIFSDKHHIQFFLPSSFLNSFFHILRRYLKN